MSLSFGDRLAHLSMRTLDWLRQRSDLKYQVLYITNNTVDDYWLIVLLPFCHRTSDRSLLLAKNLLMIIFPAAWE
jgi:hypothetical protein